MLRVTVHEDGMLCRLELAGKLTGAWIAETEQVWRASLSPGRTIEVDLRQLTGIDNAGRDLLAAIQQSGACLIVEGVWLTALLGELSSQHCGSDTPQLQARKPRRRPRPRNQENNE